MTIKTAVCALINHPSDNTLFLGVSRKDNQSDFGLPGGKVDGRETHRDALSRELQEETGLILPADSPLKQVSVLNLVKDTK